jgi:hypothetical protein
MCRNHAARFIENAKRSMVIKSYLTSLRHQTDDRENHYENQNSASRVSGERWYVLRSFAYESNG